MIKRMVQRRGRPKRGAIITEEQPGGDSIDTEEGSVRNAIDAEGGPRGDAIQQGRAWRGYMHKKRELVKL